MGGHPLQGLDRPCYRYTIRTGNREVIESAILKSLDPAWNDAPLKAELKQLLGRLQSLRGFDRPWLFDPTRVGR
jgi:hypothetical protein